MKKIYTTLFALVVALSSLTAQQLRTSDATRKVATAMTFVENFYVDKVDEDQLAEDAVKSILQTLDPHSSYLSAEELKEANEPLEGDFDGIGISFNMMADTLYVIETVSGGPSERVGIMPGDRIVQVNDTSIAGVKMPQKAIMKRLKGKKGTIVNVKVVRRGMPELLTFKITRDRIPITSIDAAYMVTPTIGYIRLSRFGAKTGAEFLESCKKLQGEGMVDLILDLQQNGGGYMGAAIEVSNQFLGANHLIVYTEGAHQNRQQAASDNKGIFKKGKLVVLINESSASASEIVSGAIQDWDRGVIVGRRSFGKGLVQRPFPLPDGSEMRLTTARYYTPTGRSIQRPYEKGNQEAYAADFYERYNRGELQSSDSIHFPDSLKFKTLVNERTVYGGGGIMPDYFVPFDTTMYTTYRSKLIWHGALNKTALTEVDLHRKKLLQQYPTIDSFIKGYTVPQKLLDNLIAAGEAEKIEFDEAEYKRSEELIKSDLKSLIARDLFDNAAYFKVSNHENPVFGKGFEIIKNTTLYNSLLTKKRDD
ncbi:S41 family peptidase [Dysgonomonas sp. 25]|uniref:S41 family peptidase n=1 Tax=Dysgonomonas sp. 25 TaxID=2302933 RepID=UPI0013D88BA0|nr:S41 family peptidase [Dysgonomonas sp. 25]NDV69744.1 S41 family peptidase [Dysgonomonas sp. 25]